MDALGDVLGRLWASWEVLGAPSIALGASRKGFGASWRRPESVWEGPSCRFKGVWKEKGIPKPVQERVQNRVGTQHVFLNVKLNFFCLFDEA